MNINDLLNVRNSTQLISEATAIDSTLWAIIANGESITQVFETLKPKATKWMHDHGLMKGFGLVAGGTGSKWTQEFYATRLKNELYDLVKHSPNAAMPLRTYLKKSTENRDKQIGFFEISELLPPVLIEVGQRLKHPGLIQFATNWTRRLADYRAHLVSLIDGAEAEEKSPTAKSKNPMLGQQATQAETIIASILKTLPSEIAGDIRHAIARRPDKLLALQQELSRRRLKFGESFDKTITRLIFEAKKAEAPKPRNFVAKNAQSTTSGSGAHKDKKRAEKQGDIKHKGKSAIVDEAEQSTSQQIETRLLELQQLLGPVAKLQKNHHVFEKIESEIHMVESVVDSIAATDAKIELLDTLYDAVEQIRLSNNSVYSIERKLKELIKHLDYQLDDAKTEEAYSTRFGDAPLAENSSPLAEALSYASDKGYSQAPNHKQYNIFVSKKAFNQTVGFIAVAERSRDNEAVFKANGDTPAIALAELRNKIDAAEEQAVKVSGAATVDFNAPFVRDILENSTNRFYAKIISGPKLVIASDKFNDMPELLLADGFSPSSPRSAINQGKAPPLPGIPLSAAAAGRANLVANGRYLLGAETQNEDGHAVFDLEFDSIVISSNQPTRLNAPGLTVGSPRITKKSH